VRRAGRGARAGSAPGWCRRPLEFLHQVLTNKGFSDGRSLIEPERWHSTTAANGGYQAPISGSGWRAMKRTEIGGDTGARPDLRVVGVHGVPGPAAAAAAGGEGDRQVRDDVRAQPLILDGGVHGAVGEDRVVLGPVSLTRATLKGAISWPSSRNSVSRMTLLMGAILPEGWRVVRPALPVPLSRRH
jgi:hypothetical protein